TSAASHSFIYNIDEMDNYATGATYFCSATVAYKSTAGTTPTAPPTTPPTVPANVKATVVSSSQINLAWTASTDSAGVAGYTIYRNGAEVGTAVGTSYNDTGLSPDTTYTYTVSAYDASGNQSAQSTPVSATTPKASARRRR
ncbi:MAG: fibronectin type III domain-containing protein, partial [Syntrophorhabdales bacterium]